jgi:aspartate racemase
MKRIGIVGGLGPESTLDYYRRIIAAFQAEGRIAEYPEMVVYSANLAEFLRLQEAGDRERMVGLLLEAVRSLHRAGAEFAAIASNTPHQVFDRLQAAAPLPMLSIVEAAGDRAAERGLRRLALLGTAYTMRADFYPAVFRGKGLTVFVPSEGDQELIQRRLFTEIELGVIRESTRRELLEVVGRMRERHSVDAVILGCTELPLILDREEYGIPFLNTTAIHVERIVRYCRQDLDT